MDIEKIEFLELKRCAKTLEKEDFEDREVLRNPKISDAKFLKNATNPIMGAFEEFKRAKKFNIKDLKDF